MMVGEVPVRSARAVQRQVVVRQTRGVDPGGGTLPCFETGYTVKDLMLSSEVRVTSDNTS